MRSRVKVSPALLPLRASVPSSIKWGFHLAPSRAGQRILSEHVEYLAHGSGTRAALERCVSCPCPQLPWVAMSYKLGLTDPKVRLLRVPAEA